MNGRRASWPDQRKESGKVVTHGQTLREIGEFGLIDRIASILGEHKAVVGIGDDCAVIDTPGPDYLLATVDMLVEDIHFRLSTIEPVDLGRRALAVSVSDVTAMGGEPTFALTSLAAPPELEVAVIEELYRGLRQEADRFEASVVGGNLARTTGPLILDVTMLGRVGKTALVLRSGARPGDLLAVTGALGDAAAARLSIDLPESLQREDMVRFREEHIVPEPPVRAGSWLAASGAAHAMLDISDGLASDLQHLTRASQVGAVIYRERLPISPGARRIAEALQIDPYDLALSGGEDYQLLASLPERWLTRAQEEDLALHVIGAVLPAADGVLLETPGGGRTPLQARGWRHF